jgi:tetratricopeptide (TPR) repeat protein
MRRPYKHKLAFLLGGGAALLAAGCGAPRPTPDTPSLAAAMAHIREGRFEAASSMLEALTLTATNSAPLYCNLGIARWRLGDIEGATAALTRATDLDPTEPRPAQLLGRILIDTHNFDAAMQTLSEIPTPDPRTLTLMAMAQYRANRPDKAMVLLGQALEQDPRYPAALYDMAVLYRDVRLDADAAARYYTAYRAAAPTHHLAARGSPAFVAENPRLAAALTALTAPTNRPAASDASAPTNWLARARAAILTGDTDAAVVSYKTAIHDNPSQPDALWELAGLYEQKLGLPDRAHALRVRFKRLFPDDPRAAGVALPTPRPGPEAAAIFKQGLAAYERKDHAAAITLFTRALTLDPSAAGTAYNLGLAHKAAGHPAAAIAAFRQALALRDDMTNARYMLGLTQMGEGDKDSALETLNALLRQAPHDARTHFLLGLLYDGRQRPDMAAIHFRHYLELEADGASAPYATAWLKRHGANAN